jgi:hypothetical protein
VADSKQAAPEAGWTVYVSDGENNATLTADRQQSGLRPTRSPTAKPGKLGSETCV